MFNRFIAINTENSRSQKSGDFSSKSSREWAGRPRFFSTGFPSTDCKHDRIICTKGNDGESINNEPKQKAQAALQVDTATTE